MRFGPVPASYVAIALVSAGSAVPLTMMVHGSVERGIDYHAWSWWAVPAVWAVVIVGALVSSRHAATGALIWSAAAAVGLGLFWQEFGLLTFGPLWLLGVLVYARAGQRLSYGTPSRSGQGTSGG